MTAFTLFHVALSLVGIATGFVVMTDLLGSRLRRGWTAAFLWTTLLTSLTGFLFPFRGFTPALAFGILSTLLLAVTFFACYARKLAGGWRTAFVVTAVFAQYLNFFVLIVQAFLKIPALHVLAPTQQEPPFATAQGCTLLVFIAWGFMAVMKFKPAPSA